jgi:hypothetical protein
MIHGKKSGRIEGNNDCRRKRKIRNTDRKTLERKEEEMINKEIETHRRRGGKRI